MSYLEDIINFCVQLARQMIVAGANLERVHLAVEVICKAYGLKDISIFFLSSYISLGAYDSEGNYSSRQASIPSAGIHLERLKSLNQLSYKVAEITPNPKVLDQMLERAMQVQEYNTIIVLLGRICAMTCLSFMFGGTIREVFPVAAVTALMHFLMPLLENTGLDRIVINALTMFISTLAALALVYSGFSNNLAVILITISMIVIPGIPLVNAMRNLLCGREINGCDRDSCFRNGNVRSNSSLRRRSPQRRGEHCTVSKPVYSGDTVLCSINRLRNSLHDPAKRFVACRIGRSISASGTGDSDSGN